MIKKEVYQSCVENLLEAFSSPDSAEEFRGKLAVYVDGLAICTEQSEADLEELGALRASLAEAKAQVVPFIGELGFAKIEPGSDSEVGRLKAQIGALTSDSQTRINGYVMDHLRPVFGLDGIEAYISNDKGLCLGTKTQARSGNSANARPGVKNVKPGQHVYYRYANVWYEVVGTPDGLRVFNMETRAELTDIEDLPKSSSAATKKITGGWGDALRGAKLECPEDQTPVEFE